jgi:transcriptional regulator with XRE-family HTH domain
MQVSVTRSANELGRVKRAMVRDLRTAMRRKQVSQAVLARRISTSRSAIGWLLKAEDSSLTLRLLGRIAVALDARVNLRLAERARRRPVARKKSS